MEKVNSSVKIIDSTKSMFIAIIGTISFITIFFLYIGYIHHNFALELIIKEEKKIAGNIYKNTLKNTILRYESIANNILVNKNIIKAFENKDREKLLELTAPIYKKLTEENPYLKIMHFHTDKTRSFLRLHKPKKYGDDLSSIRHMINKVNNTKTKVIAMEAGRYGIYYRIAVPVFSQSGKHLGVFEFGININYILDTFNNSYDFTSILLLKKDIFSIIYENNKNISYSPYSNDYYSIASDIKHVCSCNSEGKNCDCSINPICDCKKDKVECNCISPIVDNDEISMVKHNNDTSIVFTINTIKDINTKEIGKILFIKNMNYYTDTIDNLKVISIISAAILLLVSIYFMKRIFRNYTDTIHSYQSKLEIKNRTLLKLVNIDHLTKINNRKSIDLTLVKELRRSKKQKSELSVIIFDIDNFKKINDTYGHNVGDKVLKTLAKVVSSTIRDTDFFGRWGGEEFIIVSPQTSIENALVLAEKVRTAIASYKFDTVNRVTCSIGVARYLDEDTSENIIHNADTALYEAKHSGKNKVVAFKREKN